MATLVPDAVINAELQETVSRASIRRMIQGGSSILAAASETQRNQRLAEAQAAGIEPSPTNPLFLLRTDIFRLHYFDGSAWRSATDGGDTEWIDNPFSSESIWGESDYQIRKYSGNVYYTASLVRSTPMSNGQVYNPHSSGGIRSDMRPKNPVRFTCAANGVNESSWQRSVNVVIDTSGAMSVRNNSGGLVSSVALDAIFYPTN